ncbi:unnamed protein product [Triticum turgidum subsp. durum]|uniref:3'-5' exonuclease domain-containing protein n=2 Tax=Triticum turgidum subsp. durum TaxID=4567 RepID=A0A9R1QIH7_TRITD|nr:unnamed protein product [Triticum turgidum subsp. durum]
MAEEPSAKHPCGETSDQSTKVDDVQVPGQKLDYKRYLKEVDIHDKEKLDVVCTSNPDEADKMISRIKKRVCGLYPQHIGVDVKHTREDEPSQRVAVLQLCVEELCLVYHITVATKWPKSMRPFLKEDRFYTFAGFSIEGDKQILQSSGLEINPDKYIDIQRKWRVLFKERKIFHSLADVAGSVIHPFYKKMKKKIDSDEDHKLWGINPLPNYLIEYAVIDAYATYESWKRIENIREGLESAKEADKSYDDPYYGY